MKDLPIVTIVCPTLNEEKHIEKTLNSFLNQELRTVQLEIFIIDGMSNDLTREIVSKYSNNYSNVRLIDNPNRKTPYAFNKGIAEAKGEYVAILGAHTEYSTNYIQTCVDEINRTGSVGCAGRVLTKNLGTTNNEYFCKLIMSNKFAVSGNSFRTVKEGYTSVVNFPVYQKKIFDLVGTYDLTLHRNQDNDLNSRIIQNGYKLYNTWKTECWYAPPSNLKKVFMYAYKNGFWSAKSFLKKPKSMKLHHFIPFFFVLYLIIFFIASVVASIFNLYQFVFIYPLIAVIILHLGTGLYFAYKMDESKTLSTLIKLPFLFFAFHFSYGWGTFLGFITPIR